MKSAPFKYLRPDTLEEALDALAEHGSDVRVLAGGQSLGAMLNMRIVTPSVLLDINRIVALDGIEGASKAGRKSITTGAMVRQRAALDHCTVQTDVPLLAQALPFVGHYQTRNRGTLGGSLAHADPSAEISLAFATLGGDVALRSKRRTRMMEADAFFRSALVTAREQDELITSLHWPARTPAQRFAFLEFAIREGDFAVVAVACMIDTQDDQVRLGFGGCGETPQVVERNGVLQVDASGLADLVHEVARSLDYRSDLLASAAYRHQLATVLAREAINKALTREVANA